MFSALEITVIICMVVFWGSIAIEIILSYPFILAFAVVGVIAGYVLVIDYEKEYKKEQNNS